MRRDLPWVYCDWTVLRELLEDNRDTAQHPDPILSVSGDRYRLCTSVFAVSRVLLNISRTAPQRIEAVQKAFYELCETWEPRIQLIAFSKEAADVLWRLMQRADDENRLLTFESGIELATADARKVVRLLTYDEDLLPLDEITATHFPIAKPTRDQDLLGLTFSAGTESRMPADGKEASDVRLDADTKANASAADNDPLAALVAQMRGKRGKTAKRGTK